MPLSEDDGRYVITNSGSNSYCMHIKTGTDIKSTPIYNTVDGRFMMGSQSHETLSQCIDSKGKSYPNLVPVKRKNVSIWGRGAGGGDPHLGGMTPIFLSISLA